MKRFSLQALLYLVVVILILMTAIFFFSPSKPTMNYDDTEADDIESTLRDLEYKYTLNETLNIRGDGPSMQYEVTRRQIHSNVKELGNYLNFEIKKIRNLINLEKNSTLQQNLDFILNLAAENNRWILSDIEKLPKYDGYEDWRQKESQELSDLVQARFNYLQNPKDCARARKAVCDLSVLCGFGCQLHHVMYCLIMAYATERTLILNSKGWNYNADGWESVFLPLSETCTDDAGTSHSEWPGDSSTQVLYLPIIGHLKPRPPYLPLAVPEDLADRLQRIHGDPVVWWIGQVMQYLLRLNVRTENMIRNVMKKLGFQKPIVGVHIRRTDKLIGEAEFYPIDDYMKHVKAYYDQLKMTQRVDRRVYLATDDPAVVEKTRVLYPNYNFIGDLSFSTDASVKSRFSDSSLRGLIVDLILLAQSDYLVCTLSSNFCRAAYELMQTMHVDAANKVKSLDRLYFCDGQIANVQEAVLPHEPLRQDELQLNAGDQMGVVEWYWYRQGGFFKGKSLRTSQVGLFPSFKVKNKIETASFPKYPQVL